MGEAKAKKQKEQEEKTKKQEQQKLEKEKKEEEARAKKEAERLAKQQKQEQEKFEKLQKEKSKKEKVLPERQPNAEHSVLDESIKVGEREPEQQEQANENDKYSLDDVEKVTQKDHQNIEEDLDIKSESKVIASVIKRGVPKNTKPAPAVVAVKMADLLSVPDNENDLKEDDPSSQTGDLNEPSEITVNAKEQKQSQEEKQKLEKDLKQQEKLKKEEEAKAKKEQERLAKHEKQEQEKLEKSRKEELAKAKKQKEREEKLHKQQQQKLEKQRKEEETKAKKEEERKAKQEKKEQEKLKEELTSKGRKQEELSETKSNADFEGQMEDMKDHHIDIEKQIINDPENEEDKPQSELKPTDSVIKRGIPKNTKPAPPVVAIPMAELLGVSDDTECPDVEGLKCEADPQSHVEEEKADQVEVEETPTLSQSILYEHESIDNTDYDVQKCLEQDQFDVATISQPTEGGIKRGVPKNVKPAPAVVAIKMAKLLTVPDDEMDLNVQDSACATVTTDGNAGNEADDKKKQQLLEKQRQDEKLKLEKELNQKEKLKKEEEARAIKEQEKLAKLRKKEEEKLKREDEARAKKEKDLEEKRQKQIREAIEKQKKEEEKQKKVDEAKAKKEKEKKAKLEKQE